MVHRFLTGALVVVLMLAAPLATALTLSRGAAAQATPEVAAVVSPCDADASLYAASDDPASLGTVPEGLAFHLLATGEADAMPTPPLFLQVTRLSLDPGAGSETRMAGGPILFYVEAGAITFYVDGVPTTVPAGGSLTAPSLSLYALANEGEEVGSVMRFALAPQGDNGAIMVMPTAEPVLSVPPTGAPRSEALYSVEVTMLPAPSARLFLACLTWEQAEATLGAWRLPGPVGLRVERGQLRIDDALELGAGGCTLLDGESAHRLAPGAEPPELLLFGVIPVATMLWTSPTDGEVGPPPAPSRLTCGG